MPSRGHYVHMVGRVGMMRAATHMPTRDTSREGMPPKSGRYSSVAPYTLKCWCTISVNSLVPPSATTRPRFMM